MGHTSEFQQEHLNIINQQALEQIESQPARPVADLAFERHYTVREIAKRWGVSRQTVTRLFENEPGVLRLGREESRYKRSYFSLRVPESVMKRVHAQLRQRPN